MGEFESNVWQKHKMVNFGGKMIKTKFLFAVSFVALLVVNNSYAASATDLVPVAQRVAVGTAENPNYLGGEMEIPQSLVEYMAEHPWDGYTTTGIAGVTYVNKAVGAAGNAAQWAENRAAAAADSAIVAQGAAENAAASANDANDAVATKFDNNFENISNAIVTVDAQGDVKPIEIAYNGSGAFVTDVTVEDNGAVTLTRGDVTMPTVDTALSSTSTNAVQNKVVTSALDGKVDKEFSNADVEGVLVIADDKMVTYSPIVEDLQQEFDYEFVTGLKVDGGVFYVTKRAVVQATASSPGVTKLGTIPSGANKAGTATIWVE